MHPELKDYLEYLVAHQGADLFLSAEAPPTVRGGGGIEPIRDFPLSNDDVIAMMESILDQEQVEEFWQLHEMNLAFTAEGVGRFRVNVFQQKGCMGAVIRHVRLDIPSVDELGLPLILKDLILRPRGLILVTGATGSGKSTTLAAMVHHRNMSKRGHIMTLEDPIEFIHSHQMSIVNQREIGVDTEDYHIGLKNVLRQAPDMILIGEIRDAETMENAMMYAETGHLVLSTLHSINANQTLERIVQFFPKEQEDNIFAQVANTLIGIVSQRLVQSTDGKRRYAIVEVMIRSARIKELIEKKNIGDIKGAMESSVQDGMQTFDQHLLRLYNEKLINTEEALRCADSPGDLKLKMMGMSTGTVGGLY